MMKKPVTCVGVTEPMLCYNDHFFLWAHCPCGGCPIPIPDGKHLPNTPLFCSECGEEITEKIMKEQGKGE